MSRKKWKFADTDKSLASEISDKYNIDPFIALLLTGRGITEEKDIINFFDDMQPSLDPFSFIDMDKAVERIERAVENGEKIAIYGDYDADGVTSTSILYTYFLAREANVMYYIPERMTDGYGLNKAAVDKLKEENVNLIVTVDNGITAIEEAEYISQSGMDLVITDHHRAGDKIPNACAVVDAYRSDCTCPFKGLSGAGVALKLVEAMEGEDNNEIIDELFDLASIGILADVSPVNGENRLIIKQGIKSINQTHRPGIAALIEISGMSGKSVTSSNLMYSLIPRINAAGRIGKASRMVRLFITDDFDEAMEIAQTVENENLQRKEVERGIIDSIEKQIYDDPSLLLDRILVFYGENWHSGVLGITAARICDKYGKPCIVLTNEEDGVISGSCRSIANFSIFNALTECADVLEKFGGHTLAAGVSLRSENFELFKQRINEYAAEKYPIMPFAEIEIDCKLKPRSLSCDIANALSVMEPFGALNPIPVFALCGCRIESIYPLSDGKHIKLVLWRDNCVTHVLKFNQRIEDFYFRSGDIVDVAVTLSTSVYRGEEQLSVIAKDIRFSGINEDEILNEIRLYESFKRREKLSQETAEKLTPSRDDVTLVYKYIRKIKHLSGDPEIVYNRLSKEISYSKFMVIIDLLFERGLIEFAEKPQFIKIDYIENPHKVDLMDSPIYSYLGRTEN